MNVTRTVLITLTMAGLFPDRPRVYRSMFVQTHRMHRSELRGELWTLGEAGVHYTFILVHRKYCPGGEVDCWGHYACVGQGYIGISALSLNFIVNLKLI